LDLGVPGFFSHGGRVASRGSANVVDEDVDSAVFLKDLVDYFVYVFVACCVELDRFADSSIVLESRCRLLGCEEIYVAGYDFRAGFAEYFADCCAVAPDLGIRRSGLACSYYHGYLIFEIGVYCGVLSRLGWY
jgi:hypothetical protein